MPFGGRPNYSGGLGGGSPPRTKGAYSLAWSNKAEYVTECGAGVWIWKAKVSCFAKEDQISAEENNISKNSN